MKHENVYILFICYVAIFIIFHKQQLCYIYMPKVEFSFALLMPNGCWMVSWQIKNAFKKIIFQTMNHNFTQNILSRGSLVPYRWISALQFYLRSPRKDTVCSFAPHQLHWLTSKGKKNPINVISLSSVYLINLRNT